MVATETYFHRRGGRTLAFYAYSETEPLVIAIAAAISSQAGLWRGVDRRAALRRTDLVDFALLASAPTRSLP